MQEKIRVFLRVLSAVKSIFVEHHHDPPDVMEAEGIASQGMGEEDSRGADGEKLLFGNAMGAMESRGDKAVMRH